MDTQVKLVLTALNGNLSPPERIINLNRDYDTIPVGRASKSLSKGLQGAVGNAWFDSPVMSRHHAEIILNPEPRTVSIQDIGSMHGTFVNKYQLEREAPMTIGNGDVLTFGAEVKRGSEVFPPCSFKVNYDFVPYNAPNGTYTCPESSDLDDEDEDQYSDDDLSKHQQTSSEDGVSIESPPLKLSKMVDAIDLTGDESPTPASPVIPTKHTIDLTDDAPVERLWVEPTPVPSNTMNPAEENAPTYSTPLLIDETDEEDADVDSSDDESADGDSNGSNSSGSGVDVDELYQEVNDEVDRFINVRPIVETIGDIGAIGSSGPDGYNINTASEALSHIRSHIEDSQDDTDEEEEDDGSSQSDISLSEAAAEGLRALFEGGPAEIKDSLDTESEDECEAQEATRKENIPPKSDNAPIMGTFNFGDATNNHLFLPTVIPTRQPSPSDAAMAKSSFGNTLNPAHVIKAVPESVAREVFEKANKGAFFAAREANKATFREASKHQSMTAGDLPDYQAFNYEKVLDGGRMSSSISHQESAMQARTSCDFLDSPHSLPLVNRIPSPLPDMTSAAAYKTSKESMVTAEATANKSRCRVSIEDIISPQPRTAKRKADDISDATESELRTWANSSSSPGVTTQPQEIESTIRVVPGTTTPKAAATCTSEARPAKRFKRFIENVGYAAVGGVVAGAGLFSLLVATAPDFA